MRQPIRLASRQPLFRCGAVGERGPRQADLTLARPQTKSSQPAAVTANSVLRVNDVERPAPLRGLPVGEVAERYVHAYSIEGTVEDRWGDDWWIWEAVNDGIDNEGPLDPNLWSDVIVEAARLAAALPDDPRAVTYFALGDLAIDMLVAVDPTARLRFHAMRSTHPGIEGIFQVMQDEAESMNLAGSSPWDDDYPDRVRPSSSN